MMRPLVAEAWLCVLRDTSEDYAVRLLNGQTAYPSEPDRSRVDPEQLELQERFIASPPQEGQAHSGSHRRSAGGCSADGRMWMEEEKGIGPAAADWVVVADVCVLDVPEVEKGKDRRSADDDPPTASRGPMVFINPVLKFEGPVEPYEEGRLSLPDVLAKFCGHLL